MTTLPVKDGLILHLDAGVGITKDGFNCVSYWMDQSGQGNHAASVDALMPTWIEQSNINKQPALRFNSNRMHLVKNDLLRNIGSAHIFFVLRYHNDSSTAYSGIFWASTPDVNASRLQIRLDGAGFGNNIRIGGVRLDSDTFNSYAPAQTTFKIYKDTTYFISVKAQYADRYCYLKSSTRASDIGATVFASAGNTSDTDSAGIFIGDRNLLDRPMLADVAEVMIYNDILSSSQVESIEQYLRAKYAREIINLTPIQDIDGNTYKTIRIGNQVWTESNFICTRYNDGTSIPNVTDQAVWNNLTTGAYCFNPTDVQPGNGANIPKYGALYNGHTVKSGKLAPLGWRVPTQADYSTLADWLLRNGYNWDGTIAVGNKIAKGVAAKNGWSTSWTTLGLPGRNPQENNFALFNGYPAGQRDTAFSLRSIEATFWSATPLTETSLKYFEIDVRDEYARIVGTTGITDWVGLSVRFVTDYYEVGFLGAPLTGNAHLTVQFTDLTDPTPTSWLWEFGDGTTSTDQHPTHTYSTAGTYTVTLTVNDYGSISKTDYIVVVDPFIDLPAHLDTFMALLPRGIAWPRQDGPLSPVTRFAEYTAKKNPAPMSSDERGKLLLGSTEETYTDMLQKLLPRGLTV